MQVTQGTASVVQLEGAAKDFVLSSDDRPNSTDNLFNSESGEKSMSYVTSPHPSTGVSSFALSLTTTVSTRVYWLAYTITLVKNPLMI
jgi:hypothetical protein